MRRRDEQKEIDIRSSVLSIVRKDGLQGVSMAKVAKAAGISPASIYTYYENKDNMLHRIYHDLNAKRVGKVHSAISYEDSAEDIFRGICGRYYAYLIGHEQEYYFLKQYSSCDSLASGGEDIQDYSREIEALLDRYDSLMSIKDHDIIRSLFEAPLERMAESYYLSGRELSESELNQIFALIWNSLAL